MPNGILPDISTVDKTSFPYIFEQNVTIPLKNGSGLIRANIYRPKSLEKVPVLMTYGPFHPASFEEVNPEHKSEHSASETPDPGFWTKHGYAVVRADERGTGQSPGKLDAMSRDTSEAFFDVVELSSEQVWSTGKIGLLGISYYAGSQWRVAARQPKGLACIIPWEGMSDYYRDRCRHGGILSNKFINFWWDRQVVSNQYGLAGRAARNWVPNTIEGDLTEDELRRNRQDQNIDNANNYFRDDLYYASKEYLLSDIQVPLLSVANWGGILLHLRGWSTGEAPKVDLVLRKGDVGYNNAEAEKTYSRRTENEWPIARTLYTRYYLTSNQELTPQDPSAVPQPVKLSYRALGNIDNPQFIHFTTTPFTNETEITGHIVAHLNVSMSALEKLPTPRDIDLFLTLRHISPQGKEVFYTGTAGDPVPLCKGWQRVSLREVNTDHSKNRPWLPHRDYFSTDVLPVIPGDVYSVDVEIWPMNVVIEEGGKLLLEVASGDTQGCGTF
ncbi:hypothetical protein ZTR_09328 [Talaromyces verruculosus]|nr:hypothetical protein ZTR_09328 [Talaromyces verruculosus]